ncbi:hypothetical protein [Chengkuizengella sediminis]|uniref:hypothetical protein n=1 Tax=Chengkuizengella sediminis TaxID=1885917 RepID=UPI001389F8CC|nr:hypothetical protein [Chengkuizengella sediminis]
MKSVEVNEIYQLFFIMDEKENIQLFLFKDETPVDSNLIISLNSLKDNEDEMAWTAFGAPSFSIALLAGVIIDDNIKWIQVNGFKKDDIKYVEYNGNRMFYAIKNKIDTPILFKGYTSEDEEIYKNWSSDFFDDFW